MTSEEPSTRSLKSRRSGAPRKNDHEQAAGRLGTGHPRAGRLRNHLTFRRPKPKTPWRLWAALGGVGVVLAAIITIGVLQEDSNDTSTTEAATASSTELPSLEPAPSLKQNRLPLKLLRFLPSITMQISPDPARTGLLWPTGRRFCHRVRRPDHRIRRPHRCDEQPR